MEKEKVENITTLVSQCGCFDLQFRQDTKHNRPHSPTYYRWKVQFVITGALNVLENIKNIFGCGKIHIIKNKARFSVQNIEEIKNIIIPYFQLHTLSERKNSDFKLWSKAVALILKYKGKPLSKWGKLEFQSLIDIQKQMFQFKDKPKLSKWLSMAQDFEKIL